MNQNSEYSLTMRRIIVFAFLATFAREIVGHPYAQLIPFRIEEPALGQYNYPDPVVISNQPEIQRPAVPAQYPCRNCPNQRASYTPNENLAPFYSMPGYSTPQRFIRSNVEAAKIPGIESVKFPAIMATDPNVEAAKIPVFESVMEVPAIVATDQTENPEPAFMRSVRSALEALVLSHVALPSDRTAPTRVEAPVDATHRDLTTKKTQSQNSQSVNASPEGYGMYYNVRVQSFNSMPVQTPEQSNAETKAEARERKLDEQQSKLLAGIEQLLMGELMVLSQQEDLESLTEREFENQELYLREIKRLLNVIRKTGDSKEKVGNLSVSPESVDADKVAETSEYVTATPTSPVSDTTSTVPTTTGTTPESTVDDGSVSIQKLKSRRR